LSSLTDIKGLGPKKAELLEEKGITTIEQVSIMEPEELQVILGINLNQAKEILKSANELTEGKIRLITAREIYEQRKKTIKWIPTGSSALDEMLGGGVPTCSLVGLFGRLGAGKSQLCYQLIVNCMKYLKRKAAFIETEPQTLNLDRILQMARDQGVDLNLDDIYVIPAEMIDSPEWLYKAYQFVHQRILEGMDIGLIVIDSFNAPFTQTAREHLPDRSRAQRRHIGFLQMLARKYNIAVVMTFQVMGVPDAGQQLQARKDFGIMYPPVASEAVKHGVNYWIALRRKATSKEPLHEATLADGPMPRATVEFLIDKIGIRDVGKRRGV